MNAIQTLLTEHIDIWTAADTGPKSGRGRSSANAASVYGIRKLRELILELAVRGKLVPQDSKDEPASELIKRVLAEKAKLIADGSIRNGQPLSLIAEQEAPFDLPHGWDWVRLGQIGDWGAGATPLRSVSSYYGGETPWFKSGELTADFIDTSEETITDLALKECSLRLNQPGDVLIAMYGATIGKTAILKVPGTTNQAVCACTPYSGIFNRYLLVLLKAMKSNFIGQGAGGAQPNISREKIIATIVAIPPAEEQHRIVAKVDELMALCDQLETQHNNATEAHEKLVSHLLGTLTQSQSAADFSANWQRIAAHFDTLFNTEASIDALKHTLLQLAVMGKLVLQDSNDEPASELLKRIQAEKAKLVAEGKIKKDKPLPPVADDEKQFALPKSWAWVKPEEFSIKITDGEHFRPPTEEQGVYFLSAKDVREDGVNLDDPLFISEGTANKALQRCNPEYGDLLIVSRGATVGRMCKVNIHEKFCLLGSVILVKPTTLVLSDYLSISLKSPSSFNLLINASGSTAQPAIYLKDLKEIPLSLPPIEEQRRIVAKVDELMALCEQLKTRITVANQLQQKLADVLVEQAVA
jgi:type I restriction enzyme S subunit